MNNDVKRDEGLDMLTADRDPAAPRPAEHQPGADGTAAGAPAMQPVVETYGTGAIRGAYLARRLAVEPENVGGAEHDIAVNALVRGAYVAHLATPDSGSAGDEHAGSADLVRGIYAARVTSVSRSTAATAPRAQAAKVKKAAPRKGTASKVKKAPQAKRSSKGKAGNRSKASGRSQRRRTGRR